MPDNREDLPADGPSGPEVSAGWLDVDDVLDRVRSADPEERDSVIEESCRGNPELRAEVESLLSHVAPGEALLTDLSISLGSRGTSTGIIDVVPAIGTHIGPYRLDRQLPGGMSMVYEAWDPRKGRRVVVKLAREEHDQNARDRLIREAAADQALIHPNICRIIEAGVTDDLRPFLVLEFCEGTSLSERLKAGPVDTGLAVSIGQQVADALAEAHDAGITHRDIKPENLLVDDEGGVKLLDFGSAQAGARDLTAPGMVVGTPIYMSPEQLRGDRVTTATDVWSLGVVLFEAIAGEHPFRGASRRRTLMNILHTPAPTLESYGKAVAPDLERAVGLALSPDPRPRPRAKDLATDLSEIGRSV